MRAYVSIGRGVIFIILCLVFHIDVYAIKPVIQPIYLKHVTIYPIPIDEFKPVQVPVQVLVQFSEIPSAEQRKYAENQGIRFFNYVPGKSFFAIIYPGANIAALKAIKVVGLTTVKDEWKGEPAFWQAVQDGKGSMDIMISFYDVKDKAVIKSRIDDVEGKIVSASLEHLGIYTVKLPVNKIKELAGWYGVEYLGNVTEVKPLDAETNHTQKASTAISPPSLGGYGLTGNGITVGVGDNTSGIVHVDLKDRIINYNPSPYEYHGVHTSGIVGAAGIIDPQGEGIAPHTTIINEEYSTVWEQTAELFAAHNMTITNNSYASSIHDCKAAGVYDINSEALDKTILQNNLVTQVFAAGNDGYITCAPFPTGYATISGGYQPAKNNIVVASVDRNYLNADVTGSAGPIKDGRLKPEIVAVGANVYSTTKTDEYLSTLGTSMACPQVAGALALISERYKQLKGNIIPRSDILKAIVLNGATDVANEGPDFTNGFGVLNVGRSLQILDSNRYITDEVNNGGTQFKTISVPPNTAQLKVLVCWNDPAASPAAATQLVNDLDLEVQEPSAKTHRPLILDPSPANVTKIAVEGVDRLNNTEQVVINNPVAGAYIVNIKGSNVPFGPQQYVWSYDFIPKGIHITFPVLGSALEANDSMYVYWDASDDANSFTLQISTDGGNAWTVLDNNIPASQRFYKWQVPSNISSGKCLFKLTRNNTTEQSTTGFFVINLPPEVQLDAIQCPGYISINWTGIPAAAAYEVIRKVGPYMQAVDTTSVTNYIFKGLYPDSFYFVAVRPIIDGLGGYRSKAVSRQPKDGNCSGNFSDGDLLLYRILTPNTGRQLTSTALNAMENLSILVVNTDDAACNNYRVSYSINGAAWQSQVFTNNLPPLIPQVVNIPNVSFSGSNSYQVKVAIENLALTDPVKSNDTAIKTILSLNNNPIDVNAGFTDDFETMPVVEVRNDSIGVSPNGHWDFFNSTDTGRFRSFGTTEIAINGNRSISLDAFKNTPPGNENQFIGTFNLAAYNAANDEVRAEFTYVLHGLPKFTEGNEVWARGNDTQPWVKMFAYDTDLFNIGKILSSGTQSLTDLLHHNNQQFSTSSQIRFVQHDSSVIALRNFGNGLTIDDVKLYTVKNDVQLAGIVNPKQVECGLSGMQPLTIRVFNSVYQPQANVQLYYRLDSGSIINELLPTIQGKDTIDYTFTQKMDLTKQGSHTLDTWLVASGDTYTKNDSILNVVLHNQPLITHYPYREDFEKGNGAWYSEGIRNTWEYGTPASKRINKAASGTKAWKTKLQGNYNNFETSYLYSPCFDVSKLNNPYLKFSIALDVENCGEELCDAAYMEYSIDGNTWMRLGSAGEGINWYNDKKYNLWSIVDTIWHKAGIGLIKNASSLRLRYVLKTDPGVTHEGVGIDDVEIYDRPAEPVSSAIENVYPNPTRNGIINIDWIANTGSVMDVKLMDITGRVVYTTTVTATDAYNRTTLQAGRFSTGVYLLKLVIDGNAFEHKIIFQ